MIETLVVFGASGDLIGRLVLPAVAALNAAGDLGRDFHVIGAGHQDWTEDEVTRHFRRRLAEHASSLSAVDRDAVVAAVSYQPADVTDPTDVAAVLELVRARAGPGPVAVYLALPTQLMLAAVRALGAGALPPGSRVAVEKPFGYDARSAADLNAALAEFDDSVDQRAVYRVDHALAMTEVQKLPDMCAPGTTQPIDCSGRHIEQLDLLWEETLALEGRASFYDRAGALRDVMQNHLVQVLCTLAQAPGPADGGAAEADPAQRREAVLRTVRPLSAADLLRRTRRARYTAGRLADGRSAPDYAAETGVDPGRDTETFAEVTLELDSPRWAGTRIVLRAGKALAARRRGVLVHLRPAAGADAASPKATDTGPVWLDLDRAGVTEPDGAEPAAYRRIIADLLSGGTTYAVSAAETDLAWRVFTPVLRAWANGSVPLETYPAGSSGP